MAIEYIEPDSDFVTRSESLIRALHNSRQAMSPSSQTSYDLTKENDATWGDVASTIYQSTLWKWTYENVLNEGFETEADDIAWQTYMEAGQQQQLIDIDNKFNPYSFYLNELGGLYPEIKADPIARSMAEEGKFDDATDVLSFLKEYYDQRQYYNAMSTMSNMGTTKYLASLAGQMFGGPETPAYFIPIAGQASAAAKVTTGAARAAKIAKTASKFAAIALTDKLVRNQLIPASNEKGMKDEAFAAFIGGSLGGSLQLLKVANIGGKVKELKSSIPTKKIQQLMTDVETLVKSNADEISGRTLPDEKIYNNQLLQKVADEPAVPGGRTIYPLYDGTVSDSETLRLVSEIESKYTKAGEPLHIARHTMQDFSDTVSEFRKITNAVNNAIDATPADYGAGLISELSGKAASRYTKSQSIVTPSGRLSQNAFEPVTQAWRTIMGSAKSAFSKASAIDPQTNISGSTAEGFKQLVRGAASKKIYELRTIYKKIPLGNSIEFNGTTITRGSLNGYNKFLKAVGEYSRMVHDEQVLGIKMTLDAPSQIKEACESCFQFFRPMRDKLEDVDMIKVGPSMFSDAKLQLQGYLDDIASIEKEIQDRIAAKRPVKRISGRLKKLKEKAARYSETVSDIERVTINQQSYMPIVYNTAKMLIRQKDFVNKSVIAIKRFFNTVKGKQVSPDKVPIRIEAAEKLNKELLAKSLNKDSQLAIDEIIKDSLAGDLTPELRAIYDTELDNFINRLANNAFEHITNPDHTHGVIEANPSQSALLNRVFTIAHSELSEYMINDVESIIERYSNTVGGKLAVAEAIHSNPYWSGVKLKSGLTVTDSKGIVEHVTDMYDTIYDMARLIDEKTGANIDNAVSSTIKNHAEKVIRDLQIPINRLEGRTPIAGNNNPIFDAFSFFGRNMLRVTGLTMLGSAVLPNVNDLASLATMVTSRPFRSAKIIGKTIYNLKSLDKRALEAINVGFEGISSTQLFAETDSMAGRLGFGSRMTRKITSGVDRFTSDLSDWYMKFTLLDKLTKWQKTITASLVIDEATDVARKIQVLNNLTKSGMPLNQAIRKAGLKSKSYQRVLAEMNHLGLNEKRIRLYNEMVYKHGLMPDDTPIRNKMSFDEYLNYKKFVKPNFDDWRFIGPSDRVWLESFKGSVAGKVHYEKTVTPGVGDRPIVNYTMLGKLFNQFQSFQFAFINQRMRSMAQLPINQQLWYLQSYLMLGAITNAAIGAISGRRSIEESVEGWKNNPLGMTYAAADISGLLGILSRVFAATDALGVPLSPGNILGETPTATAVHHVTPGKFLTFLGPAAGYIDRLGRTLIDIPSGNANKWTLYNAMKLTPIISNCIYLRALHAVTGMPVTAESISGINKRKKTRNSR